MEYTIGNKRLTLTASEAGAELCSLTLDGQERIWDANPAIWGRHAPMCFPICGSLEDGWYQWRGALYHIPERHGFARDQVHTLADLKEDALTFRLEWPGDGSRWPWFFTMETEHKLLENGSQTSVTVENRSSEPMPVQFGFHPAFVCPFVPGSALEEYRFHFEGGRLIPLEPHLFDNDSIPFSDAGAWVRLEHIPSGKYIQVETAAFPVVLIWSKPGIPGFVCIEPWEGFPGPGRDLAQRPHAVMLQPGQRRTWIQQITFA